MWLSLPAEGLRINFDRHYSEPMQSVIERASGLQPYSNCEPGTDAILMATRAKTEKTQSGLKYFLIEEGGFDFRHVERCWEERMTDLDDHVKPNVAEHLSDLYILKALRKHADRTHNISDATLGIIGVPFFASWAADCEKSWKEGLHLHYNKMAQLVNEINRLPQNMPLFAWMSWWHVPSILGEQLLHIFYKRNIILATSDADYPSGYSGPRVVVPYRAHYLSERTVSKNFMETVSKKNFSFMFHGSMNRRFSGSERNILSALGKHLPNSSIESFEFDTASGQPLNEIIHHTASVALQTSFCFVPEGDTVTSRRLFDALAVGCIPVVLADLEKFQRSIVFPSSVDWSQVALFGGKLECIEQNMDSFAAWLLNLLEVQRRFTASLPSLFNDIRKLGMTSFQKFLSFGEDGGQDIVSALLLELDVVLSETTNKQISSTIDDGLTAETHRILEETNDPADFIAQVDKLRAR